MGRKPKTKLRWDLIGLGALTLATAATLGFTLLDHPTPPPVSAQVETYKPIPKAQSRVIGVIGDSYTGGSQMGGLEKKNWTVLAEGALDKPSARVAINHVGLGGSGYVNRGPSGKTFADVIPQVAQKNTDVVAIFGSINDQKKPLDQVNAASAGAIAAVRSALPQARIVIIGPAWMDADVPADILAIRDALATNAAAAGASFVDPIAEKWFFDRPELIGSDGTHPTDAGHAYMAEKIAPHLTGVLGSLPTS